MTCPSFGKINFAVSQLGMGCSSLGGLYSNLTKNEAIRLLEKAYDGGINFFDTAPTYNMGKSEALLGQVFKNKRDRVFIATKVGIYYGTFSRMFLKMKPYLKPLRTWVSRFDTPLARLHAKHKGVSISSKFIQTTVEGSLRRLRTDHLNLLQLHHISPEKFEKSNCLEMLESLKKQGKILSYGVSCDYVRDALVFARYAGIEAIQIPVNMIEQEAIAEILPITLEKKIAVIARVPLAQGLLTDKADQSKARHFTLNKDALKLSEQKAKQFHVLRKENRTLAQSALRFLMQTPGIHVMIPGYGSLSELKESMGALTAPPLTEDEIRTVRSLA
jgi:aryl-alcohol dehydrogenase-like predicted oxidoreductase